jgi:hypothetical protein
MIRKSRCGAFPISFLREQDATGEAARLANSQPRPKGGAMAFLLGQLPGPAESRPHGEIPGD